MFRELVKRLENDGIEWIDLQVTDLRGTLHHVSIHRSLVDEDSLKRGFGKLDGSSVKGFTTVEESDLVLSPIPETYARIPWLDSTARFICRVHAMMDGGRFDRDPRLVAEKTEEVLSSEGFTGYASMEPEFFIFNDLKFQIAPHNSYYVLDSHEADWSNTGGVKLRTKEGYYPVPPMDRTMIVRQEIADTLIKYFNVKVEVHHHEVAGAGQAEINFKYDTITRSADNLQTLKYVAKNIAYKYGMAVTFMPKPLAGDNGNGMHTHVSLWRGGVNSFYDPDDEYAELSQTARYFIGGLLEHGRALSAIVSPTTNSYRRLIPGFEAPVYLAWSRANRSAAIRIPSYHRGDPSSKRIEYRPPDPSANPYLAVPAIFLAGLDGIKKKIDPGDPVDRNIYHMSEEERKRLGIKSLPRNLEEALDELESDYEFLKPAFPESLIQAYIDLKREEVFEEKQYPSPIEFLLYHDI